MCSSKLLEANGNLSSVCFKVVNELFSTSTDSEISSDSIMTLSSDNESEEGNNTDLSGESIIEPYNPSQKVSIIIVKTFPK